MSYPRGRAPNPQPTRPAWRVQHPRIELAKGVIAQSAGVGMDEAFARLRGTRARATAG